MGILRLIAKEKKEGDIALQTWWQRIANITPIVVVPNCHAISDAPKKKMAINAIGTDWINASSGALEKKWAATAENRENPAK
jgi:hypothetical protein